MARTFIEWTPASGEGWYASGSRLVHWSWEWHLLIAGFGYPKLAAITVSDCHLILVICVVA